eukprot:360838-Chlamydomonas_euryale.AAC.12
MLLPARAGAASTCHAPCLQGGGVDGGERGVKKRAGKKQRRGVPWAGRGWGGESRAPREAMPLVKRISEACRSLPKPRLRA